MSLLYSNSLVTAIIYTVLAIFAGIMFIACIFDKFRAREKTYRHFIIWGIFSLVLILLRLELTIVNSITDSIFITNGIAARIFIPAGTSDKLLHQITEK